MRSIGPVIASNPVAKTMMSTGYSASVVQIPARLIRSIGALAQIDQRDVRAVVGLEIIGIDRRALRRVGMIDVRQDRRRLRVLDDRADLALDEIRRRVVRRLVDHHVLERRAELQTAALPRRLVDRLAFLGRGFDRQALFDPERHAVDRFACGGADFARRSA